jgi:hypothetical protein
MLGKEGKQSVMLSLSKHLYRSSNPNDWIYYHKRDASTALSMTFFCIIAHS